MFGDKFRDVTQVLREMEASEITVTDVTDASSVSMIGGEEDKFEYDDDSRVTNACSSEISSQPVVVRSDDNAVISFLNLGDCVPYENVEDDPNTVSVSSFNEKQDVQNSNVNEPDALVTTTTSTIMKSEIEGGRNCCENNPGTVNDDTSLVSKCALDFQELSSQSPSNDCPTSVSELNTSEYSHGIGAEPMVTLLGKPKSNRKDTRIGRTVTKRVSKSHKARPRRVETNVKPSSGKTENDENIDESFKHNNVGLPNKVDSNSTKPPPKLESKCNCIIM